MLTACLHVGEAATNLPPPSRPSPQALASEQIATQTGGQQGASTIIPLGRARTCAHMHTCTTKTTLPACAACEHSSRPCIAAGGCADTRGRGGPAAAAPLPDPCQHTLPLTLYMQLHKSITLLNKVSHTPEPGQDTLRPAGTHWHVESVLMAHPPSPQMLAGRAMYTAASRAHQTPTSTHIGHAMHTHTHTHTIVSVHCLFPWRARTQQEGVCAADC
jgi:hypothetical protein